MHICFIVAAAAISTVATVVIIAADKAAMVTKASQMSLLLPTIPMAIDSVKAKAYCIANFDATIVTIANVTATTATD